MRNEKVRKTLSNFGLTENETEIYIFLAKRGVLGSGEIIKGLRMHRADVYRILKRLQTKGLVESTLESPARFAIIPFETVLESFIKAKHDEATSIEKARKDLLEDWKSISKPAINPTPEKFIVIEGNYKILCKIQQMIRETQYCLSMSTSIPYLVRAEQFGLFDSLYDHALNSKIEYRFLTDFSSQNLNFLKAIVKRTARNGFRFRARNPAIKLQLSPNMVIRDCEEILFFITPSSNGSANAHDEVCMLTNCKALVQSFSTVFEELWQNAAGAENKIAEIETGNLAPKLIVFENLKLAEKKHEEALRFAKKQVLMTTSSKGLIDLLGNPKQPNDWAKRAVSVKIMAPITGENLTAALNLPECCQVRHVPNSEMATTIVDGQKLFQFESHAVGQAKQLGTLSFDQAFYSDDPGYVEKMQITLEAIWRNSHVPSPATLNAILGGEPLALEAIPEKTIVKDERFACIFNVKNDLPKLAEKEVLHKILVGKKYPLRDFAKGGIVNYGSRARAIIKPPEHFGLPELMIEVIHLSKRSSFGREDALRVYWRHRSLDGSKYTLAAVVTDSRVAAKARKTLFPACNSVEDIQLVRKDELQVRVFGNTLFAGWTMPIQLSPGYNLPPACILYEAYGEIRTRRNIIKTLDDQTQIWEINDYEAFVTFFHPKSKYVGPGTEGEFARDCIVTTLPFSIV